ncbi:hypothetical protein KAT92_04705, partial [Candidatus Babeliales bacterium]|nr:hypothetical protein [Candidatus Babeliales bacterium]
MNKRFFVLFLVFLVSVFQTSHALPIGSVKGTYNPFKPEFKRCSPLQGAIWWEFGLVEKYFHLGYFNDKDKDKGKGKEFRDGSLFLKGDGVPRLIHNLFHVVQGSFNRTYNNSYPAKHFSPALIGKLVGKIEGFIYSEKHELGDVEKAELKNLIKHDKHFAAGMAKVHSNYDTSVAERYSAEKSYKSAERAWKEEKQNLGKKLREWVAEKKLLERLPAEPVEETKAVGQKPGAKKKRRMSIPKIDLDMLSWMFEEGGRLFQLLHERKIEISGGEAEELVVFKRQYEKLKSGRYEVVDESEQSVVVDLKDLKHRFDEAKKKVSENDYPAVGRRVDYLVDAIAAAYRESGYFGEHGKYPPYALHSILLAFLYVTADSKQDLISYFEVLDENLFAQGGKSSIGANSWLKDAYGKDDVATIEAKFKKKDSAISVQDLLGDVSYEEYVFAQIMRQNYMRLLPKMAPYKKSRYKTISFADCAGTTARNLCNIIIHNPEKYKFDVSGRESLLGDFKSFYEIHGDTTKIDGLSEHNGWNKVVQNQELVSYSMFTGVGKVPSDFDGFVPVVDLKEKLGAVSEGRKEDYTVEQYSLGGVQFRKLTVKKPKEEEGKGDIKTIKRTYLLFDPTEKHFAYELQPSLRNMIVLLNRFFGLSEFDDSSLEQTLLRQDFNDRHFNSVFGALELKSNEYEDLDIDDYRTGTELSVWRGDAKFKLSLSRGHGEINKKYVPEEKRVLGIADVLVNFLKKDGLCKSDRFGALQLLGINDFDLFETLLPDEFYPYVYFLNLCDDRFKIDFIEKYFKPELDDNQLDLIFKLIKSLPVVDIVYQEDIAAIDSIKNATKIFLEKERLDLDNDSYFVFVLLLLRKQIKTGTYVEPADSPKLLVDIARKGLKNSNENVVEQVVLLLEKMCEKKLLKKTDKKLVLDAITKVESSDDEDQRMAKIILLGFLVDSGEGFVEAEKAASEAVKSNNDENMRIAGIEL